MARTTNQSRSARDLARPTRRQLSLKTVKKPTRSVDRYLVIDVNASPTRATPRSLRSLVSIAISTLTLAAVTIGLAAPSPVSAVSDSDWLTIVNTYRAMSGLAPVTANGVWSAEAQAHSCYMLQNGITHDEIPGRPGYTSGGDVAGNSGNVAVSSSVSASARNHIDLWMTGPFHAIGILRQNLVSTGFGLCTSSNTPTPWHSAGTLDVIRGLDFGRPPATAPIVFPGDGATIPLHAFITEFPNPMTLCGWSGNAGLPLIAMMPNDVTAASATLTGPNGPIPTCSLHKGNTGSDATAHAILDADNSVIVMPRTDLADGVYTATVNSNGGNVTWSFTVDRDAALQVQAPEPPDTPDTQATATAAKFQPVEPFRLVDSRIRLGLTRLAPGVVNRVRVGGTDIAAVSANFTVTNPASSGYLTVYNCTSDRPVVSTVNFGPGQTVANQAIVPLAKGEMCVYSVASTDLVIDVNGYYLATTAGTGFVPITPARLYDSRDRGQLLRAGEELQLQVAGRAGAPSSATGGALNVTAIRPDARGYLQVYPCGVDPTQAFSNLNFTSGDVRPNTAVTAFDVNGKICIRSTADTHLAVDLTGYFEAGAGLDFVALAPIRFFDSRSTYPTLNESTGGRLVTAGNVIRLKIAGQRGVPATAKAVSINLTASASNGTGFLTAYPCGTLPDTSNVNFMPSGAVANGAMVKLSAGGDLCVYSRGTTHVIVDINGVWR